MTDVRIVAAGDAALVAELDERIDPAVNARVLALADAVRVAAPSGVRDVVPTYRSVTIYFDPLATDVDRLIVRIRDAASAPATVQPAAAAAIDIPVCYDGEFGPDLDDVGRFGGLTRDEVVAAHCAREYRVYMLGFVPGFAYMGSVDSRIAAPRRTEPRLSVAAGSVGIAGQQTAIYPSPTPGGWNIIGRTPLRMVALNSERPTLLAAGNMVRFHAVDRSEFDRLAALQERAA